MLKEYQIMTISRVLIVVTFLGCLSVNAQAQTILRCEFGASLPQTSYNLFPNEMEGFKFFGEGKLGVLSFGISASEDVRSIFGTPLKTNGNGEIYDYDSDWLVLFIYITKHHVTSRYTDVKDVTVTKKLVTNPEYVGKIGGIILRPKKNIQFNRMNYPDNSVKELRREKESHYTYSDSYGLTYKVFDGEVGRMIGDLKEENVTLSRGGILEIAYRYPCSLRNYYIEEK
jgi:hypothetical protein